MEHKCVSDIYYNCVDVECGPCSCNKRYYCIDYIHRVGGLAVDGLINIYCIGCKKPVEHWYIPGK